MVSKLVMGHRYDIDTKKRFKAGGRFEIERKAKQQNGVQPDQKGMGGVRPN